MKHSFRRLLCLALVLLLAALPVCPVTAQTLEPAADLDRWVTHEAHRQLPTLPQQVLANTMTTAAAADITVDGTAFSSTADNIGEGWTYTAKNRLLTLTNYNGGSILSEDSLHIVTHGDVTITAGNGESGICVKDQLTLEIADGTLTVTGGTVNPDNTFSGYGILGVVKTAITGSGLTVTGGSSETGAAGMAVYGGLVEISADGTYTGGSGKTGGAAVGAMIRLIHGAAKVFTADFIGGMSADGSRTLPVYLLTYDQNNDGVPEHTATWDLNVHLVLSSPEGKNDVMHVAPAQYTLTLQGEGVETIALTKPYPTSYALKDHLFTRDGFVQVGWQTDKGDQLGLNWTLTPESNLPLTAVWRELEEGTIVLQGTDGTFTAGGADSIGSTEPLPDTLTGSKTLLAWCTEMSPGSGTDLALSGRWFSGGTQADADVQTLYAQTVGSGQYAIFHPTLAALNQGGNILVYGIKEADTSLSVTPDLSAMTPPAGFTFRGWAAAEQGDILYTDEIPLAAGVTALYAQWAYPVADDLDLTWNTEIDSAVLSGEGLSDVAVVICAAYDGAGKQTNVRYLPVTDGQMVLPADALTGEICKVFFLTKDHLPAAEAVKLDLDALRNS